MAKITPEQHAALDAFLAEQVAAFGRVAAAIARAGFVAQDFERLSRRIDRSLLPVNSASDDQAPHIGPSGSG